MTDPMWENPTEPRTKAGRRLIASFPANAADASRPEFIRHVAQSIRAIEEEAAAQADTAPGGGLREAVVRLRDGARRSGDGGWAQQLDIALAAPSRDAGLDVERLRKALTLDWTPFWRETPIEEADGVHGMSTAFDLVAFTDAVAAEYARPALAKHRRGRST